MLLNLLFFFMVILDKLTANVSSSDVLFLLKVCTDALMGKQNSQKFAELIATASPSKTLLYKIIETILQ